MVTNELTAYIRDAKENGMNSKAIAEVLRTQGWSAQDIRSALREASPSPKSPDSKQGTSSWHVLAYTFSLITILSLSGLSYYLWQDRIDLRATNEKEVQQFYMKLAQAQISFTESGEFIFPDEQKFLTTRDTYIGEKTDFIEANLKTMTLTLYDDGVATATIPILTKGKEKSWWETPTGNYEILGKSVTAFSSIGHVWMPYSMQFYGNYFIHGWPHYDDGTPVPQGYSGGCIRLSNEDAEKVYAFAKIGTPILVLEDDSTDTAHSLVANPTDATLPDLTSQTFRITDLTTGTVILERNSDTRAPIGNIAKLMTAVVAHEILYLGRSITVTPSMIASVSDAFKPTSGTTYTGLDLLYPLLMQSSDEAANILSGTVGGKMFVTNMNTKALSLEMKQTRFEDATGRDVDTISTPTDITKLLHYVYYKRPFLYQISKGIAFDNVGFIALGDTVNIDGLSNTNPLIGEANLVGVMHGDTEGSSQSLATIWDISSGEKSVPVSIVVLGSSNALSDTEALHTWITQNYMVE